MALSSETELVRNRLNVKNSIAIINITRTKRHSEFVSGNVYSNICLFNQLIVLYTRKISSINSIFECFQLIKCNYCRMQNMVTVKQIAKYGQTEIFCVVVLNVSPY